MSGHSKVGNDQTQEGGHRRQAGKVFAKLIKNIEVAAKIGGADPAGNPTLADAIQKAKKSSVPNDNIDRAVKRGAGLTGDAVDYQTIMYEGYGPGGIALLIECLTDNRNRAAAEVRTIMSRNGGQMADPGSVAYNFSRKGVIAVAKDGVTEDDLLAAVLDSGAEEVLDRGEGFDVITDPSELVQNRKAIQDAGLDYDQAEVEFVPNVSIEADMDQAKKVLALIDALEDSDDVQNVFTNMDLSAEVIAQLAAEDG
jgi:DNA-binding regulatory protein, YebC/PmpR family